MTNWEQVFKEIASKQQEHGLEWAAGLLRSVEITPRELVDKAMAVMRVIEPMLEAESASVRVEVMAWVFAAEIAAIVLASMDVVEDWTLPAFIGAGPATTLLMTQTMLERQQERDG